MQAFTAKGTKEKWVVTHNGNILDKIVSKAIKRAVIRKHTTITYLVGGAALLAFRAEKKKALAKGLEISNYDRTVEKPKIVEVKTMVRPKGVKLLGRYVPVEG